MLDFIRAAERTLKPLIDAIGEGLLVVDERGSPLLWNAAAERILGSATLRHEAGPWVERAGVFASDGVTPLPGRDRPLPRAIRGETVTDQELVIKPTQGDDILVSCTARALRGKDDRVIGGVAVFREITERRRAEAALRESERLYRTIAEHLPSTVIMMYDSSLHFILVGGGALGLAGFSPEQIEGRPVAEFASPSILANYAAVFAGQTTDTELTRADGRHYRVQLVPIRDEQQHIFAGLMVALDITDQKHREEALHRETHFKLLAEAIPQIVWTANPDGFLDYYNQRWFDYTGMTLEQTQGWGWAPVIHPDDLQNCVDRWTDAVRSGNDYEVHYRFKRASDATYRWHLGRALPVRGTDGEIVKWFGTCTDIDDQRRAQEGLRQAHEHLELRVQERTAELAASNAEMQKVEAIFRAATEGSLDAFYIFKAVRDATDAIIDFTFLDLNSRGALRIGAPREHLLGRRIGDYFPVAKIGIFLDRLRAVITTQQAIDEEQHVATEGSSIAWLHHQIVPLHGLEDCIAVTSRDITGRKAAEAQLAQLAAIVQSSQEAMLAFSLDGHILNWNRAAEEMFGYSATELSVGHISLFSSDGTSDEQREIISQIREGKPVQRETIRRRKNGELFDVSLTLSPIFLPDGVIAGASAVVQDITGRVRADQLIRESLAEKEVLLQEIHHRVKNNLQVVSSLLKLHADRISEPTAKASFEDAQDRVRAIALLHEKLYQSTDLGNVDVADYVASLVQALTRTHGSGIVRTRVDAHGIFFPIDIALPCGLILNELVTNAFKHAFTVETSAAPQILIKATQDDEHFVLTVQDNGVGVPPGMTLKDSKTLGLHLVRTFTRQLRGVVGMEAVNGTLWTIRFPRHPGKET